MASFPPFQGRPIGFDAGRVPPFEGRPLGFRPARPAPGQSRLHSALEAAANVAVGYLVALGSQLVIFPWFGVHLPLGDNLLIGAWFTLISIVRSYTIRRWFNRGLLHGFSPRRPRDPLPPVPGYADTWPNSGASEIRFERRA